MRVYLLRTDDLDPLALSKGRKTRGVVQKKDYAKSGICCMAGASHVFSHHLVKMKITAKRFIREQGFLTIPLGAKRYRILSPFSIVSSMLYWMIFAWFEIWDGSTSWY